MIGVSVKTMYNYENKITKISSDDLKKISNTLKINLKAIFISVRF